MVIGAVTLPASSPSLMQIFVSGDGATNAQIGHIWYNAGTTMQHVGMARGTAAEDSTTAKTLTVTIQYVVADVGNTNTMEHAVLELL